MTGAAPDRPARPEYGEYATPEEQRARIQQPDATHALSSGQSLDAPAAPVPPAPPYGSASTTPPALSAGAPAPVVPEASGPARPVRRPRTVDRIATFALLGYGLFNVLTSIPAFTEYSTYANTLLDIMGVDAEFSGGGRGWGLAAAFVLGLGWLLTATLTWLNLRRGRITWWIPLVGGVVFTLTASVLLMVPLFSDPTIWNALVGSVG
ncbi:MAG: DUF6264 family protein [Microbacterium sp.]|uniref:DUF6264 family protein n=1 Tax=Microbacterium sp. TaxID=51671 RepID=UPI002723D0DB|nr:DUF6264 family protein [Microbacterium sp.]MDO8382375.1 DUF6264 family protein [Microbacterium sp.]